MSRAWDKQKILIPRQDSNDDLPNIGRALYPLSYGELIESVQGSHVKRVLHTARISNVEIVLYGERMKDGMTRVK